MPQHDDYGKMILQKAVGPAFKETGRSVEIDYGVGSPARIDGTIGQEIAVEIESRVSKQVRGAVLDLICHKYKKKLLVLLPVHMSNPETTADQCRYIFGRFLDRKDYHVVVLEGDGDNPQETTDIKIVQGAIQKLRTG